MGNKKEEKKKEVKEVKEEVQKEHHFFRTLFFLLVLIISLIIVYGRFIETRIIFVNEHDVKNEKIPTSFNGFEIGHFSDILYSSTDDKEKIKKVSKKLNDKKLDIVIFSGDLIKKGYNPSQKEVDYITKQLSSITTKYGKYYVTGDNDLKNNIYDNIMQNSGFISINNSSDTIYRDNKESILLLGLTKDIDTSILSELLKDNKSNYKILVFHESDSFSEIKNYNLDLVLSSNSLNGQINIPGIKNIFLNKNSMKYYEPYYKYKKTDFYISNGIGNEKINIRLLNNPSINIYNLKTLKK